MPSNTNNVFLVLTNPTSAEADQEFNLWYTEQHIPDIVSIPGFVAATRYRLSNEQREAEGEWPYGLPYRYLAVYEMDPSESPPTIMQRLMDSVGQGMDISDTLAREGDQAPAAWVFEAITHRITKEEVAEKRGATAGAR